MSFCEKNREGYNSYRYSIDIFIKLKYMNFCFVEFSNLKVFLLIVVIFEVLHLSLKENAFYNVLVQLLIVLIVNYQSIHITQLPMKPIHYKCFISI